MNLDLQVEMLANRVRKNFRKLAPRFEKRNIGAFRVYDWDIPEIRAAVDWYEGHLVVAEYARTQTDSLPYLEKLGEAAQQALQAKSVHLKKRRAGEKYERFGKGAQRFEVRERDLKFLVNLDDFIDTGLFADHRETRALVAAEARGKSFLNLFAYTGSFTCAALKGGAKRAVTVDTSQLYLDWARDHLVLNDLPSNDLLQADAVEFVRTTKQRFELIVLDPPSHSDRGGFDVQRDHRSLIDATLALLEEKGTLWFSTNHQRFEPQLQGLHFEEMTKRTVPEDYRRTPHRSFRITS
jgi:23S rRNA (cytosine1962-C5)-methyltransferase